MKNVFLILAALTLGGAGGCLQFDAPCEDPEPGKARCDVGYECVKEDTPVGEREVCKKRGSLDIGEKCQGSELCRGSAQGASVCADKPSRCRTGTEAECDFRCRPTCSSHEQCGTDQICWADATGNFCQEGDCGVDNQDACPSGQECLWFKGGPTGGLCFAPCDLLLQSDCNTNPNAGRCCAPQESCIHFATNPAAAACLGAGTGNLADLCDTEEGNSLPSCKEGLFCSDLLGGDTGRCYQYCRRLGGGGPACDRAGAPCLSFLGGENLEWGYCGE
ncbi:MAG: hypothetical protein AB2A00_08810 [Myxococcota bacterium]